MWHSSFRGSGQNGIDFRIILWKIIVSAISILGEREKCLFSLSGKCFDFDCLCASSLGVLVLKHKHKVAFSRSQDFPSCTFGSSSTPRCIFLRSA